jgi:hypothetical protein
MKFRSLLVAGAVLAAAPASALAVDTGQLVSGTTLGTLAISVDTPAAFVSNFNPDNVSLANPNGATATGAIIATSTNPTWVMSAQDQAATTPGYMDAAATGCSNSDSDLDNPVKVKVDAGLLGGRSAGVKALSGTSQTVASATGLLPLPLAADVLTTTYTQAIPASQRMETGCVYSLTTTFTLQ